MKTLREEIENEIKNTFLLVLANANTNILNLIDGDVSKIVELSEKAICHALSETSEEYDSLISKLNNYKKNNEL